jgi:FecR protein
MDDVELINEVLELTLAYQRGDASAEERARLERLLLDNPQAISWYLRVVEDSLTLRASALAHEAQPHSRGGLGEEDGASAADAALNLARVESEENRRGRVSRFNSWGQGIWGQNWKRWAAPTVAACFLLVATGTFWWFASSHSGADAGQRTTSGAARVVNVSNVEWSSGAKTYDEWSFVEPGDTIQIERGLVNLFFDNGAEMLIEGPADVDFVSLKKVFARKGKLAARVSPSAIGFSIETPHANVIDRGTAFGLSVDEKDRTDVVVYEGMVDLDVLGNNAPARRRLERGEALSVSRMGELSRITTVESSKFLEPPQVRAAGGREPVISSVSDNVRSLETTKYYRVIPGGFREDCRAYVDRAHEWNGVDQRGLPPFLVGGDYVMTYNDDKVVTEFEIAVGLSQPAALYVIMDDRVPPPAWLERDFVDTHWDVGSDEGYDDRIIANGVGPGESIDHTCSVWRRDVLEPTTVVLGALGNEKFALPAVDVERSMYGVVAVPLGDRKLVAEPREAVVPKEAATAESGDGETKRSKASRS